MKRFVSLLLLCCLLLCVLPFSAAAEDGRIEIEEMGLTLSVPEGLVAFTRDVDPNDPNLSAYGLTREQMLSIMRESNLYFDAWDEAMTFEITATVTESMWSDFGQREDYQVIAAVEMMKQVYAEMGLVWLGTSVYDHSQTKFAKIEIEVLNSAQAGCGIQYVTTHDGKLVVFSVKSLGGALSAEAKDTIKRLIDSIRFAYEPPVTPPPAATEAFRYTHTGSGISFTVPANWRSKELSSDRQYIDAVFVNDRSPGVAIAFTAEDVWFKMIAEGLELADRSEIDNSLFTEADVAGMLATLKGSVTRTRIRGVEYFRMEGSNQGNMYGLAVSAPVVCLVRFENGYMYQFMFSGEVGSDRYEEFQSLIYSVDYPEAAPSGGSGSGSAVKPLPTKTPGSPDEPRPTQKPAPRPTRSPVVYGSSEWESMVVLNFIVSLLLTVAVYSLPIIIYRYAIRKKPMEEKKARRLVILYAIGAFIVMAVLLVLINGTPSVGGAIFLWSWINYKMLTGGSDRTPMKREEEASRLRSLAESVRAEKAAKEAVPDAGAAPSRPAFCRKCGKPVDADGDFCRYCGAKLKE